MPALQAKRKPKERKGVPRWPGFSYSEACLACPGKRRSCYTKPGLVLHATEKDHLGGLMNGKELEDERGERGMYTNGWHFSTQSYLEFSQDTGLATRLQVF